MTVAPTRNAVLMFLSVAFLLGGFGRRCADWVATRNPGHRLKFVALTIVIAKPLAIAFYFTQSTSLALMLFIIPAAFGAIFSAPTFAQASRL